MLTSRLRAQALSAAVCTALITIMLAVPVLAVHGPPCGQSGDDWYCDNHSVDLDDRELRWEANTQYDKELQTAAEVWDKADGGWTQNKIYVGEDGLDSVEDVEVDDHANPSGEFASYWGWWQPTSSSDEIFLNLEKIGEYPYPSSDNDLSPDALAKRLKLITHVILHELGHALNLADESPWCDPPSAPCIMLGNMDESADEDPEANTCPCVILGGHDIKEYVRRWGPAFAIPDPCDLEERRGPSILGTIPGC